MSRSVFMQPARSSWEHSYCIERTMKFACLMYQLVDMSRSSLQCPDIKRQKCPIVTQSVAEARRNPGTPPLYDVTAEGSEPASVRTLPLRAVRVKCRQERRGHEQH